MRVKSSIKGTTKFEGSGVSYCATCDGFFHKNTDVAVLGNGSFAEAEAKHLSPIASNVYVLTNGDENPSISADEKNIKIVWLDRPERGWECHQIRDQEQCRGQNPGEQEAVQPGPDIEISGHPLVSQHLD